MLFNVQPFSGALFPSVISPQKGLDAFPQVVGPHILLFHDRRGLVLFPPVTGTLWPEADLGRSLESFRLFTEGGVVPAERHHLEKFWKNLPLKGGTSVDKFVIKTGRIRQVTMLGFHVTRTAAWGHLLIVVPGENPQELDGRLSDCCRGLSAPLLETLGAYVEDSDKEALVGEVLSSMPEEFSQIATFERTVAGAEDGSRPRYSLFYRRRGGVAAGGGASCGVRGKGEEHYPHGKKGHKRGGVISFSVYVGGVRSLGNLYVPVPKMQETGLSRLNIFLHDTSERLCRKIRETVLSEFAYTRH